jgi:hypothetical protein
MHLQFIDPAQKNWNGVPHPDRVVCGQGGKAECNSFGPDQEGRSGPVKIGLRFFYEGFILRNRFPA